MNIFWYREWCLFLSQSGGSFAHIDSYQWQLLAVALSTLSSHESFSSLRKKATEYVEDNRKLLSRLSLCSVHNLVEKQKTVWRANLVHQGMYSLLNLMSLCSSLGNRIFEKVSNWSGKISECAGVSRNSPPMWIRQPRSGNSSGIQLLFLNYLRRV